MHFSGGSQIEKLFLVTGMANVASSSFANTKKGCTFQKGSYLALFWLCNDLMFMLGLHTLFESFLLFQHQPLSESQRLTFDCFFPRFGGDEDAASLASKYVATTSQKPTTSIAASEPFSRVIVATVLLVSRTSKAASNNRRSDDSHKSREEHHYQSFL